MSVKVSASSLNSVLLNDAVSFSKALARLTASLMAIIDKQAVLPYLRFSLHAVTLSTQIACLRF